VRLTLGLYKIFVYLKAFVHERIIPFLPLPICIAHTIAILLHGVCVIYDLPQQPFCMPYTIQNWYWQCLVKTKLTPPPPLPAVWPAGAPYLLG